MRTNQSFILVLLMLLFSSCSLYTSQEEELLRCVSNSLVEEQRKISENIVQNKEKLRKEVADNGNKPSDKKVEVLLLSLLHQTNQILRQLDTLIQKTSIEEKQLVCLKDSIKKLETFVLSMKKENSYLEKTELPSKIRNEYFQGLEERKDLSTLQGKLYLLALRNKLLMWEENRTKELCAEIGSSYCGWNPVLVIVEPESETVDEGTEYKAKVYWAVSVYPKGELKMGNTIVSTKFSNRYNLNFKTSPGPYDENGLCKKQWTATYTFMNHRTNEDTTLIITRDYYVRKTCK
jgi:hypothetical protein